MNLTTNLVDLTAIVGMLASWGIVPNALQFLRDLFLDSLLQRASDASRNAVLRALLFVLSFAGILALALILGQAISINLIVSAILAASGGAVGAHATYQNLQKTKGSDPAGATAPNPTTADGAPGQA